MIEEIYRKSIIEGLIRLRKERNLSQAEFAQILRLSQQRLSEIERKGGSITAEQFVALLQRFNLSLSYFIKTETKNTEEELALQNALARLGAKHLRESPNLIVPEKWESADEVIFETLYSHPSARLIPALASVIVKNIQKINFNKTERKLYDLGYTNRLSWLLEATLKAVQNRSNEPYLAKNLKTLYRRAETILASIVLFREQVRKGTPEDTGFQDVLDQDIISEKTRKIVERDRDELSKKWQIITRITQKDFDEALANSESYV